MKILNDVPAFFAGSVDKVNSGLKRLKMRFGSGKIVGLKQLVQGIKTEFIKKYVSCAVTHTRILFSDRVCGQSVTIRALNAMHASRIFRLGTVEKSRRGTRPFLFKICDFECMQMFILGLGNAGLPPEVDPAHRYAVA
jgi:hypothetical protein